MHRSYLLIGGPRDGDRLLVRQPIEVIECAEPKRLAAWVNDDIKDLNFVTHLYYREEFRAGKACFIMYRHESLSIEEMVAMLIDNYKEEC